MSVLIRTRANSAVLFVVLLFSGCAHLGDAVGRAPLPEGTPTVQSVLEALEANDRKLDNFKAAGSFLLEAPDLDGIQRFPTGSVAFERPDKLRVVGRILVGGTVFRLVSVGEDYLIEFPKKRDPEERFYDPLRGLDQANVPDDVSPSDVAREMFLPEDWGALKRRERRIVAADLDAGTLTITVGPAKSPHRELIVGRVGEEEDAWVVLSSTLLDTNGDVVAITVRSGYHVKEGIRFAEKVEAWFPQQGARLTFDMRNIRINEELDDDLFVIERPTGI